MQERRQNSPSKSLEAELNDAQGELLKTAKDLSHICTDPKSYQAQAVIRNMGWIEKTFNFMDSEFQSLLNSGAKTMTTELNSLFNRDSKLGVADPSAQVQAERGKLYDEWVSIRLGALQKNKNLLVDPNYRDFLQTIAELQNDICPGDLRPYSYFLQEFVVSHASTSVLVDDRVPSSPAALQDAKSCENSFSF